MEGLGSQLSAPGSRAPRQFLQLQVWLDLSIPGPFIPGCEGSGPFLTRFKTLNGVGRVRHSSFLSDSGMLVQCRGKGNRPLQRSRRRPPFTLCSPIPCRHADQLRGNPAAAASGQPGLPVSEQARGHCAAQGQQL